MLEGSDQRVVVFAHHHDVVDALMEGLKQYNPVRIDGRVAMKRRNENVATLRKIPNAVFLSATSRPPVWD